MESEIQSESRDDQQHNRVVEAGGVLRYPIHITIDRLDEYIEIRNTLVSHGLVQDIDFTMAWVPPNSTPQQRHVIIEFVDPGLAAMYALMWQ
jgi:hypothetical protein